MSLIILKVGHYESEQEDAEFCDPCFHRGDEERKATNLLKILNFEVNICDDCLEMIHVPQEKPETDLYSHVRYMNREAVNVKHEDRWNIKTNIAFHRKEWKEIKDAVFEKHTSLTVSDEAMELMQG